MFRIFYGQVVYLVRIFLKMLLHQQHCVNEASYRQKITKFFMLNRLILIRRTCGLNLMDLHLIQQMKHFNYQKKIE